MKVHQWYESPCPESDKGVYIIATDCMKYVIRSKKDVESLECVDKARKLYRLKNDVIISLDGKHVNCPECNDEVEQSV